MPAPMLLDQFPSSAGKNTCLPDDASSGFFSAMPGKMHGRWMSAVRLAACLGIALSLAGCIKSTQPLIPIGQEVAALPQSAEYEVYRRAEGGKLQATGVAVLSYDEPTRTYMIASPGEGGVAYYKFVLAQLSPTTFIAQEKGDDLPGYRYYLVAMSQGVAVIYDFWSFCEAKTDRQLAQFSARKDDVSACVVSSFDGLKKLMRAAYQEVQIPNHVFVHR